MKSTAMSTKSRKQQMASSSKYSESVLVRLDVGTLAHIDDVLERFEDRSHMLREAIEREIKRRSTKSHR
jgi:metal-responsive CopG/Arc/MetJ family transcriptional regulator